MAERLGISPTRTRTLAAILLAFFATGCAIAAARGPAVAQRAQYSWPPTTLGKGDPTRTWVAPLFLARHRAKTIQARLPCRVESTLRDARVDGTVVLLATTRDPARERGLAVTTDSRGTTRVSVGRGELGRFATTSAASCVLDVRLDGLAWRIDRTGAATLRGRLSVPARVVALITEVDLRSQEALRVTVQPIPQDTRPSGRQTILRLITATLLAAAIGLLLSPRARPGPWRALRPRPTAQDGVVALTLGTWWILAPLHFDDGWVRARQENSLYSGGFSNYYEPWGANLPQATWLEWLQHFAVARSDALAVHRLPTVLVLVATWIVCRRCLTRLIGREPTRRDAAWWSATLTFALGAAAFGITLRPEPAISLLAVTVMWCCLRWLERPSLWLLVTSVVLVCLSVTIHPTGAVAAGPMAVLLPSVIRGARRGRGVTGHELIATALIGLATLVLLAFLDADYASHQTNLELLRDTKEHGAGPLQEFERYEAVSQIGASTPRRLVVALILLAGVAGVVALLRKRTLAERIPTASVLLGLVVFAIAPSKWIWHFGALVGLCVVAVGIEAHRLAEVKLPRIARWYVVAAALIVALWASRRPGIWGPIDTERFTTMYLTRPYTGAILLGVAALAFAAARRRIERPHLSALPVIVAALLLVTTAMFAMDAAAPGGWSSARQVLSMSTDQSCGVGSDLDVSVPLSLASMAGFDTGPAGPGYATPRREAAVQRADDPEWQALPRETIGVFVRGLRPVDRLRVTWGRRSAQGVAQLRSGYADLRQANWGYPRWQFVADDSFPTRPREADVVRLELFGVKGARSSALVTNLVRYQRSRLSAVLLRPRAVSWVSPFIYGALPCADLPRLAYGLADAPNVLIDFNPGRILRASSLYAGIGDVFDLMRVPLGKSEALKYIVVYWVRPDPRDAIAPPVQTVVTS